MLLLLPLEACKEALEARADNTIPTNAVVEMIKKIITLNLMIKITYKQRVQLLVVDLVVIALAHIWGNGRKKFLIKQT